MEIMSKLRKTRQLLIEGGRKMAFVYEEVGKENEALWNEIGWRDWGG